MNFKEYIADKIINESPMETSKYRGDIIDNEEYNIEDAKTLLLRKDYKEILIPNINYKIKIFEEHSDNNVNMKYDSFVNDYPNVIALICYINNNDDGGISIDSSWNHRKYKGFAFNLMFNYYLKNFNYIVSGDLHTNLGKEFWKKIIQYSKDNGYKISILNDNVETTYNDKIQYWGTSNEYRDFRIKIYKK